MYSSAFYKMEARNRLKGNYGPALIGTLIYLIPAYLMYLIDYLFTEFTNTGVLSFITEIIFNIFVLNIFWVGYMRFLLNIKPLDNQIHPEAKRFDFNDVLSGYTHGFKNTVKTMPIRDIYLLLWGLIAGIPALILAGIIAYLSMTTDIISNLYNMILLLLDSPTPDMMNNVSVYIMENCSYLPVLSAIAMIATIVCIIPVIYKSYEYSVIPMILAENPEMNTKKVFHRSLNIMQGYRWKFFCIQFSFFLYMILTGIILISFASIPIYYLAQALLLPYMWTTLLIFYIQRRDIINHNISVYGEN